MLNFCFYVCIFNVIVVAFLILFVFRYKKEINNNYNFLVSMAKEMGKLKVDTNYIAEEILAEIEELKKLLRGMK